MSIKMLKTGEKGWLGLVAYIFIVNSIAWRNQAKGKDDETMSLSWARWLEFPRSKTTTCLVWAIVTGHLFLSFPLLPGQKALKNAVIRIHKPGKVTIIMEDEVIQL